MCADNRRQSLTSLRVVEDPASATGWSVQVRPDRQYPTAVSASTSQAGHLAGLCRVAGGVANVRLQPSV